MKIGINLFDLWSPGSRGEGVLNYARGLVKGLAEVGSENDYVLFLNARNQGEFNRLPANFNRYTVPLDAGKRRNRVFWEQVLLPIYFVRQHLDLVHFPSGTSSLVLLPWSVVTHHAANVAFYTDNFRSHAFGWKQFYIAAMERLIIPRAARIITVSEFSRRELVARLHADPARIAVVAHALPE